MMASVQDLLSGTASRREQLEQSGANADKMVMRIVKTLINGNCGVSGVRSVHGVHGVNR